jgi:phosphatidylserine decarboxylase
MLTCLGKREIIKYGLIVLIFSALIIFSAVKISAWFYLTLTLPAVVFGFILYFFRDPERKIPADGNLLLSPADGTVTHLEKIPDEENFKREAWRVSIFMSIFDVHLNRAPFGGAVEKIVYKKGEFFDARNKDALNLNESNTIIFSTANDQLPLFVVRQIAGLIARRIVCTVKIGDEVCAGSKIGMMKFSSRCELIVPVDSGVEWSIKIGDHVSAGESILGKI